MSRFVVDACVAIKWVEAEEHSVAALRFAQSDSEMHVPELFFPEALRLDRGNCHVVFGIDSS